MTKLVGRCCDDDDDRYNQGLFASCIECSVCTLISADSTYHIQHHFVETKTHNESPNEINF